MKELEERRQRAREAGQDAWDQEAPVPEVIEAAIETAIRMKITPEVVEAAQANWPQMTPNGWLEQALERAFRAAGFEVEG